MPVSLFFESETSSSRVVKSNWALIHSRGFYRLLPTVPIVRKVRRAFPTHYQVGRHSRGTGVTFTKRFPSFKEKNSE